MLDCLLVADDLTGGADTGHGFADRGYPTVIGPGGEAVAVRVVDTESRTADPSAASEAVRAAVEANPARIVYKKVDSTLRGNIGTEIGAAVLSSGAELAVVAPAFPAAGRTTADGTHLVDGAPVADTGYGADDENPPVSSDLETILEPGSLPVDRLSLRQAAAGPGSVDDALCSIRESADTAVLVACDATHDSHLRAIAEGAAATGLDIVYVGSAGLARFVPLKADAGSVLGVVGSTSRTTFNQLEEVPTETLVYLDPERVSVDMDHAVSSVVETAVQRIAAGDPVVVTTARSAADVRVAIDAGSERGWSSAETREHLAKALGDVASGVVTQVPVSGIFATGGTIARTVLEALGVERIRLTGTEVLPGIPIGQAHGGVADGTTIVTKAGGFGDAGTITTSLGALSRLK